MEAAAIARALHVVAIVLWIGGVAFATTIVAPTIRRTNTPESRLRVFLDFEQRFVWQARASVVLAGLTGVYLVYRYALWERFLSFAFWWLHAMVALWLLFAVMLFVLEPFVLDKRWHQAAADDVSGVAFGKIERMHRVLLTLSLAVVFSATAGAHGLL